METMHVTANADALRRRAAQLIAAGRTGAAGPLLAAARTLGSPSAELTLMGARLALATGAWEQAMQELDIGIAAAPSHPELRKCRANVRQRIGDLDGAARDAAEAVIFDPADPQAKAILGAAMLDLGRPFDAVACLTEAVAGAPSDLDYPQALATAQEKSGDTDAALSTLTIFGCSTIIGLDGYSVAGGSGGSTSFGGLSLRRYCFERSVAQHRHR